MKTTCFRSFHNLSIYRGSTTPTPPPLVHSPSWNSPCNNRPYLNHPGTILPNPPPLISSLKKPCTPYPSLNNIFWIQSSLRFSTLSRTIFNLVWLYKIVRRSSLWWLRDFNFGQVRLGKSFISRFRGENMQPENELSEDEFRRREICQGQCFRDILYIKSMIGEGQFWAGTHG